MRHGCLILSVTSLVLLPAACTSAPQRSVGSPSTDQGGAPASFGSTEQATIAFHSDPGGRDDTYVMNGDGTDLAAVTGGMETIAQPYWSPDGERLVVACCTSELGHLFVFDGPGGEPLELAPDRPGAVNPAWSPDGSTIAFESIDDRSLYLVDVSGSVPGKARPLGVSGAAPSWSPDGGRIAYFADDGGDLNIYTSAIVRAFFGSPMFIERPPAVPLSVTQLTDSCAEGRLSARHGRR